MQGFELIEIQGETPFERGVSYGMQAKEKIQRCIEDYAAYFKRHTALNGEQLRAYSMAYVPYLRENAPDALEELRGVTEGSGAAFEDLMVLNCRYEITKQPQVEECTTAALLREATGRGPMLVKNWDYRAGVIEHIVLLHIHEADGTRILGLTEAGQLIREGFNSHGVGLCNNALKSKYDGPGTGMPATFLRRLVLSCRTFAQAKALILRTSRSVSNNMLLASRENLALDIEANPRGNDFIEPKDGILTHANHFTINRENNAWNYSYRDSRLRELLMAWHGTIDIPYIKKCMSDHANYPKCICAHPENPGVHQADRDMTVANLIIDFDAGEAHVCSGPPCTGKYKTYRV